MRTILLAITIALLIDEQPRRSCKSSWEHRDCLTNRSSSRKKEKEHLDTLKEYDLLLETKWGIR